jgi:hypothetical protein
MCSFHHRKRPTTRSSPLLMGLSILDAMVIASGARNHSPPTSLPLPSHIDIGLVWVRPPIARVSWQERSARDILAHQLTHWDNPTIMAELRMPGLAAHASALLAPSVHVVCVCRDGRVAPQERPMC